MRILDRRGLRSKQKEKRKKKIIESRYFPDTPRRSRYSFVRYVRITFNLNSTVMAGKRGNSTRIPPNVAQIMTLGAIQSDWKSECTPSVSIPSVSLQRKENARGREDLFREDVALVGVPCTT